MSKPLELTIYPPTEKEPLPSDSDWPGWDDWLSWDRANTYEFHKRQAKRLTESELAAEWHRHTHTFDMLAEGYRVESFGTDCIQGGHHEARVLQQQDTLHRFATHPHYFEDTKPESDTE